MEEKYGRSKSSRTKYQCFQYKMRMWFRGGAMVLLTVGYTVYNIVADSRASRELSEGGCPQPADPKFMATFYALGVLYLFVALAIVADEFFVPALDIIAEWWDLSPDVAGATLMAAGGSAPELFTSAVGTFLRSSVGFGAIVGSAVFNVLFVVGICAVLTNEPMQLTWYPMIRDSTYYCFVLLVLAIFFGVTSPQIIEWWEALILHLLYWVYVTIMMYNKEVYGFVTRNIVTSEAYRVIGVDGDLCEQSDAPTSVMAFRGSLLTMLTKNASIYETAGTHLVTKITGSVEKVFQQFDKDGSGAIDSAELKSLLHELGCPVSDVQTAEVMSVLDRDGNGTIDEHEFSLWFLSSKERVHADIDACFKKFAIDGDGGSITALEFRALMNSLGNTISYDEVVDLIHKIEYPGAQTVSSANFKSWYEKSDFWTESMKRGELLEEAAEGLSLSPPEDATVIGMIWYIVTLPLVCAFMCTVADVRRPGMQKYAYMTFLVCLAWMGIFSFFMVSWVEIIGATLGIPSVIMGLTFLAAGTSLPDMLSALIVAKQGEGDKAVSSSIGSNVFDICVGLGLPWVLFWIVYQEPIYVSAGDLFTSILTLVGTMVVVIVTIKARNWVLPPSSGYFFIFLYFCFVVQQLAQTKWGEC